MAPSVQWCDSLCCVVCSRAFDAHERPPVSLSCGHLICRPCGARLSLPQCPIDECPIEAPFDQLPVNVCILRGGVVGVGISRSVQRKLFSMLCYQLLERGGRCRAGKAARALAERVLTELLLAHQNSTHLSSNLWAAVRARGCQFLGPAMQEEVLRLLLLALSDGALISRKVLVLYMVQALEAQYPQASKTCVGHVVQLLYRASCFEVIKREGQSSLMQLKPQFRSYEALRAEHDAQILQMAVEAGLRISPDQWSSLLYGDQAHRSYMQSLLDKLQSPSSFGQAIQELVAALQRFGDPANLAAVVGSLQLLAAVDAAALSEADGDVSLVALRQIATALVALLAGQAHFLKFRSFAGSCAMSSASNHPSTSHSGKASVVASLSEPSLSCFSTRPSANCLTPSAGTYRPPFLPAGYATNVQQPGHYYVAYQSVPQLFVRPSIPLLSPSADALYRAHVGLNSAQPCRSALLQSLLATQLSNQGVAAESATAKASSSTLELRRGVRSDGVDGGVESSASLPDTHLLKSERDMAAWPLLISPYSDSSARLAASEEIANTSVTTAALGMRLSTSFDRPLHSPPHSPVRHSSEPSPLLFDGALAAVQQCQTLGQTNLTVDWDERHFWAFTCNESAWTAGSAEPRLSTMPDMDPRHDQVNHHCMNSAISYEQSPPLRGDHRPNWALYGEYLYLPPQRWLHNLEHGAVVMLFDPCADAAQVDTLRRLVRRCLFRHVITPYAQLDRQRVSDSFLQREYGCGGVQPMALLTWANKLELDRVDADAVIEFIRTHARVAPEDLSTQGSYNYLLIKRAAIVSDIDDSTLCPSA